MEHVSAQQSWEAYRTRELERVVPILNRLGFELEARQPHLGGERYLMQAVTTTSGRKLILLGRRIRDGKKVVIKATSEGSGMREIERERLCRQALKNIKFAYAAFPSPEEILFENTAGFLIFVQAFIEQEKPFLERPLLEQFELALRTLKAQESAHATTYGHRRLIKNTFGTKDSREYLASFEMFRKAVTANEAGNTELAGTLSKAASFLSNNTFTIDQYGNFLTHTDFVPHNIRVAGGEIYLLDHSSIRFGNKHEGWARFLNFMALYNPRLEQAFLDYVRLNRAPEEMLSLKLMRAYRLGEIMYYYTSTLERSEGDLLALNRARIEFWRKVLEAVLTDKQVSAADLEAYKNLRDSLRSDEEKERQKGLH